jgi:hypothetical protein
MQLTVILDRPFDQPTPAWDGWPSTIAQQEYPRVVSLTTIEDGRVQERLKAYPDTALWCRRPACLAVSG